MVIIRVLLTVSMGRRIGYGLLNFLMNAIKYKDYMQSTLCTMSIICTNARSASFLICLKHYFYKFSLMFHYRRLVLCWIGHHEHIIGRWMGILHGRIWSTASLSILMGLHTGIETIANGNYLPIICPIRSWGIRQWMRPTGNCGQDGGTVGNRYAYTIQIHCAHYTYTECSFFVFDQ